MECDPFIIQEYFKIIDIIESYDTRLLVIQGWSVTFSLVMLALGFEKKIRELFWVAAISSLCFFLLDATYKNYQTNYYPRMRQIEVYCSTSNTATDQSSKQTESALHSEKSSKCEHLKSAPRPAIDWSWHNANNKSSSIWTTPKDYEKPLNFWDSITNFGVILPYIFPFIFGLFFGILSYKSRKFREYFANNKFSNPETRI